VADQGYADLAGELRAAAHNITALAEAASVIAERSAE
jgi:hypothetical protein